MNKEIPILFSTPMVEGVDSDRKTITRRTRNLKKINIHPDKWELSLTMDNWTNSKGEHEDKFAVLFTDKKSGKQISIPCPYGQVKDILWVRESFYGDPGDYVFKAQCGPGYRPLHSWRPSIHMPKEACRLHLEIIGLRIERLHDIREHDAIQEGIEREWDGTAYWYRNYDVENSAISSHMFKQDSLASFQSLWKSINGKKSWYKNPWVWVIEFKKITK